MKGLQGTSTILVAALAIVHCSPLDHAKSSNDAEQHLLESVEVARALKDLAVRDMHAWWAQYKSKMATYKEDFAGLVCTDPDKLRAELDSLTQQVERVRNGWREKNTQLNAINDILHDEKYKNVTGLAKVLNQYIQEQFSIAHEEDGKISAEERDVVDEKQKLDTHPCPCVLSDWGEYGTCTATCGGGSKTRTRTIVKEPVNGGDSCESVGPLQQTAPCGEQPCPIDCEWDQWTEFGECDKACGPGFRHRTRGKKTEADFGGQECTGEASEQVACNLMAELTMKNEELTSENKRLKQQLNCDVTKCEITVYKDCEKALSCGSKNGVSCAYLPDGIEGTECASMPCPAVKGTGVAVPVCSGGRAIDITGGCHAYLSTNTTTFNEIFQPGFTGLWEKMEHQNGKDIQIAEGFNQAKLFCKGAQ